MSKIDGADTKPIPPSIIAQVNKGVPLHVAQSMGAKPVSTVRVK